MLTSPALAQEHPHPPQLEHGQHGGAHPYLHRVVGLSAELEVNFSENFDAALYCEGEIGVPKAHIWVGIGAGVVTTTAGSENPPMVGVLAGASLYLRPEWVELMLRGMYDYNLLPGGRIVRIEVRAVTTWRIGPIIRGVANYAASPWNTRSAQQPWEGIVSAGVAWLATPYLTISVLGGVVLSQDPHFIGTAMVEIRPLSQ